MKQRKATFDKYFPKIIPALGRISLLIVVIAGLWANRATSATARQSTPPDNPALAQSAAAMFGVELFPLNNVGGLQYVQTTQTKFVRGAEIVWADTEPSLGVYDWSKMATAIQEIQNARTVAGAETIVVVRQTPTWAQKISGYSCGPIAANLYNRLGLFIGQAIDQLKLHGITSSLYWQIWNEPDIAYNTVSDPDQWWGGCWGNPGLPLFGGEEYGSMLNVIAPLIRQSDPNAKIIIGGLQLECDPASPPPGKTCASSQFLEGILSTADPTSFDGVAFHAYDEYLGEQGKFENTQWPGSSWDQLGPSIIRKARFVKNVLASKGITNKMLFSTENSLVAAQMSTYNDPYPPDLEATKASYVAQAYAGSIAEGLTTNIWFDVVGSWLRNNGLIKVDASGTLPAFDAYKFAAEKLPGVQSVQTVTGYSGVTGYEFDLGNSKHLWLIWSQDGQTHQIHLPAIPTNAYSVTGTSLTPSQDINVTLEPVYLEMPAFIVRAVLPLNLKIETQTIGDFESGLGGWTLVNNGLPATTITTHPLNPVDGTPDTSIPVGTTSVQLGLGSYSCTTVPIGNASLEKTVAVPNIPGQVQLSFQYIIYSQDYSLTSALDALEVYINNGPSPVFSDWNQTKNSQSCPWFRVPSASNPRISTNNWAVGTIDLTQFKGQSVLISFRNYNRPDKYYNTFSFIDEIKLILSW